MPAQSNSIIIIPTQFRRPSLALTDVKVRSTKTKDNPYKLADGDGVQRIDRVWFMITGCGGAENESSGA